MTAFYAATCALAQRDLKRTLAYSTISQIGFMILGVGAGAITAATFHLLVHAFFKSLLFLGAGCIITAMHHEQDMFKMGGLASACRSPSGPSSPEPPAWPGFRSDRRLFQQGFHPGCGLAEGGSPVPGSVPARHGDGAPYLPSIPSAWSTSSSAATGKAAPGAAHHGRVLIPLALLGLFGGLLDLPGYLGGGWLDGFWPVSRRVRGSTGAPRRTDFPGCRASSPFPAW